MVTTFHDLCIDVIVEIFSYFNVHEIFNLFSILITCLPNLLINGRVQLHVRSNNSYFIRWILPHINLSQVVSLNVPTRPYNPSIFQFSGLRSLVLQDVNDPLVLLEKHHHWPPFYLEHLSLSIRNSDIPTKPTNLATRVVEQVLQLPRIKHLELHESKCSLKMVELFDQLNFPSKFRSSNIRSLILTVYCHWNTLQSILDYSPYLRSLQIRSSWNVSDKFSSELSLPAIRKLHLRIDGLPIEFLMERFLNAPFLRHLILKCSVAPMKQSFLQSDTWIRWMNTYTPQLQILDVDLRFRFNKNNDQTIEMINENIRSLNFQLDWDPENGHQTWKMTGVFIRIDKNQ